MARRFEWNDRKAELNLSKHGIGFEEAVEIFNDPFAVDEITIENGEFRWLTIGTSKG